MKYLIPILALGLAAAGCTGESDRAVIDGYRRSEAQKQLAMDNSIKMTKDQMLLNAAQRLRAIIKDPADAERAVAILQMVWLARNEVETTKEQYTMGRILTMVTVGNYLYDKQGALNSILESLTEDVNRVSGGAQAGKAAIGGSVRDILNKPPAPLPTLPPVPRPVPSTRPTTTPAPTPAAVRTQLDRFNDAMEQIK